MHPPPFIRKAWRRGSDEPPFPTVYPHARSIIKAQPEMGACMHLPRIPAHVTLQAPCSTTRPPAAAAMRVLVYSHGETGWHVDRSRGAPLQADARASKRRQQKRAPLCGSPVLMRCGSPRTLTPLIVGEFGRRAVPRTTRIPRMTPTT